MVVDYSKCKILVVDDNPANIDILIEFLDGYDVRAALDGKSALESVKDEVPDLIFLDITMPEMDGFEVCRRLKSSSRTASIPIIFLSANSDDSTIVKGFELGGVDYIVKPYNVKEVIARLHTHLKLQHAIRKLDKLAYTDDLTSLANRRRFFKVLDKLLVQTREQGVSMHIMTIDIDNFRQINDTYGHSEGDVLLKAFALMIRKQFRKNSFCARFGGDEFIVLRLNISKEQAILEANKICEKASMMSVGKQENITFTVSVGVAETSGSIQTIDALIAQSDLNLNEAKSTKNRAVGYI